MSSRRTSCSKPRSPLVMVATGSACPDLRTISSAFATLSGTTSQRAVMRTFSTPSSSCSTLRPRSPVPTIPIRTTSCFSKGTPIMVAAETAEAPGSATGAASTALVPRAIPAPAAAPTFRNSRRSSSARSDIRLFLVLEATRYPRRAVDRQSTCGLNQTTEGLLTRKNAEKGRKNAENNSVDGTRSQGSS